MNGMIEPSEPAGIVAIRSEWAWLGSPSKLVSAFDSQVLEFPEEEEMLEKAIKAVAGDMPEPNPALKDLSAELEAAAEAPVEAAPSPACPLPGSCKDAPDPHWGARFLLISAVFDRTCNLYNHDSNLGHPLFQPFKIDWFKIGRWKLWWKLSPKWFIAL